MDEKNTEMLMQLLKSAAPEDLDDFRKENLPGVAPSFVAYMDGLLAERELKRQELLQKADIPQKYGYKLLSGESHTANRDNLLRLFIALGLDLQQAQRGLTLYGMPVLYPKLSRDAVFIIAFNRRVDSVDLVDRWLTGHGEEPLYRSPDKTFP